MAAALGAPEARRSEALRVLRGEVAATPASRSEGPLVLTMVDAAKRLGVSRVYLWRLIKAGRIPKIEMLPGTFRVAAADLEAFVAGRSGKRSHGRGERRNRTERTERTDQAESGHFSRGQENFARRECAGDYEAQQTKTRSTRA